MNPTHLIIFNRAPAVTAGGWIHIVPKGELPNRQAGIVQVLDDAALDSILAGIDADKQRLGNKWPGLYAGREHFIYNDDQDSAALGWLTEFEKRSDGIWAKEDGLTDIGREAVANKRYKFTSFVADRRDTQKLDGNRVRILKIDTVGFTNQANGKELLTPLTNRNPFPHEAKSASAANDKNQQQRKPMKSVCALLGLSAEADESSVHAAVSRLVNRGDITAVDLTTLQNRKAQLEVDNSALLDEQIDGLLTEHKVADDKIRNRLKPILQPLKNRADRVACLVELGFDGKEEVETANNGEQQRLLNRNAGKTPAGKKVEGAEGDQNRAIKIQNRASELHSSAPNRSWDSCWAQASRETTK